LAADICHKLLLCLYVSYEIPSGTLGVSCQPTGVLLGLPLDNILGGVTGFAEAFGIHWYKASM